jgi:hypothetical protein
MGKENFDIWLWHTRNQGGNPSLTSIPMPPRSKKLNAPAAAAAAASLVWKVSVVGGARGVASQLPPPFAITPERDCVTAFALHLHLQNLQRQRAGRGAGRPCLQRLLFASPTSHRHQGTPAVCDLAASWVALRDSGHLLVATSCIL